MWVNSATETGFCHSNALLQPIGQPLTFAKWKADIFMTEETVSGFMPCHLTVLHCPDSQEWTAEIHHHYSQLMPTTITDLSSIGFPLKPSIVQSYVKCKKSMVLISPLFLQMLDKKPNDLFSLTNLLNPTSTIAAFCCGSLPRDISPTRMMSLFSYEKWSVVILDDGEDFCKYAQCNLDSLITGTWQSSEIHPVQVAKKPQGVLLIPQRACPQKEDTFYLIFDEALDSKLNITVTLTKAEIIQATVQQINPFVGRFSVPDRLLKTSGDIQVAIRIGDEEDTLERTLKCEVEADENLSDCDKNTEEDEELYIMGSAIDFLNNCWIDDSQDEGHNTIEDYQDTIASNEGAHLRRLDSGTRSQSLPSLSSPLEVPVDFSETVLSEGITDDHHYLEMSYNKRQALKPHERFLQSMFDRQQSEKYEKIESFLTSHISDTITPEDIYQKGSRSSAEEHSLSQSQQELVELLQAFKRGVKTISEVEHLFQEWHERHRQSVREKEMGVAKPKHSKIQRGQSFGFKNILSLRTKRKFSRTKEENVPVLSPKTERATKTLSKISNSSISSGCSVGSELSSNERTTDSGTASGGSQRKINQLHPPSSSQKYDDQSTTWFRPLCDHYSYVDEAPLNLLPSRPPPALLEMVCKKIAKPPRKPKPLPPPPSPDYIMPNDPYSRQSTPLIAENPKVSHKSQRPKKFSTPNMVYYKQEKIKALKDSRENKSSESLERISSEPRFRRSVSHSELFNLDPIYLDILDSDGYLIPTNAEWSI